MTVHEALRMRFENGKGQMVLYKRKDLLYDCKSRLLSIPPDDDRYTDEPCNTATPPQTDIDDVPNCSIKKQSRVLRCTNEKCTQGCLKVHLSQRDCELFESSTSTTYCEESLPLPPYTVQNSTYGDPIIHAFLLKHTLEPEDHKWLAHERMCLKLGTISTGFRDEPSQRTYPCQTTVSQVVCDGLSDHPVPTAVELLHYNNDGTYEDYQGMPHSSVHIRQVTKDHHDAETDSTKEGFEHIINVPKGLRQAMNEEQFGPYWSTAIYKELLGLYKMGCFVLERRDHPDVRDVGILPSHFVFTAKWTSDIPPEFIKFKARLVASGNFETESGVPFDNYSPAATAITNRFFDAYCTLMGFDIKSTDMTQAFLNSVAPRNIFVNLPKQVGQPGYCMRLLKMLYGLRQSPKCWIQTLSKALHDLGFKSHPDDPSLLLRERTYTDAEGTEQRSIIIACAYVDDIKWGTNDIPMLDRIITEMRKKFDLTDEDGVSTYLGLRYTKTMEPDESGTPKMVLKVDQTAYINTLIKRFDLENAPLPDGKYNTPLPANDKPLSQSMGKITDKDREWAKNQKYSCIIGSLIHAMVHTRPDIAYAVSMLSRAMSCPEDYHYKAAHYLLMYLKRTAHLGLEYRQASLEKHVFNPITAAVDSSFADCPTTARSTSGYIIWFCGSPLEWECKRQPLVTMSTMESEYVAASRCVNAIKATNKYLDFVGMCTSTPAPLYEDNQACIIVADNEYSVYRPRTRHIAIRYHNVKDAVSDGTVKLVHVWTKHQVADIFTKSLSKTDFLRFRGPLMGHTSFDTMCDSFPKPAPTGTKINRIGWSDYTGFQPEYQQWPRCALPVLKCGFLHTFVQSCYD